MTWDEWFDRMQLRHFGADEVAMLWQRPGNEAPPRDLWGNIVPTLLVLDELREEISVPIYLTSVYRSPEYNTKIGGNFRSQHMAFSAIDFRVASLGTLRHFIPPRIRAMRGRIFYCPFALPERAECFHLPADSRPPFQRLETWDARDPSADSSAFRWNGGIGLYSGFLHVDSRGYAADW